MMTAMLLTMMMMFSGCLGQNGEASDDNSEGGELIPTAQGSTTTTIVNGNYLPMVQATQMGDTEADISWAWENETTTTTTTSANGSTTNTTEITSSFYNGTLVGMNVTLYHAAIDPEGTVMVMGWDMNLDGTIDIPVSTNSGFTTANIPLNQWHDIPTTERKMTTVAFLASDVAGDRGVTLLDVYSTTPGGPWSEDRTPSIPLYAFSGKDAQGSPGTGTADNLIMLTMDQGSDINWAAISVKLSIDGAAPVTCDNPGVSGTAVCSLVEFGNTDDQVWSVGDGVTVVENGQELCSGSCSIDVTVTDTREGKTIDTTNGVVAE
ncbi:MAG: hypothetical protein CMB74_00995 [Euryarchaeota archaeon]|nr:hypothetical protein [Euryarchaeota archaeon]